MQGDTVRQAFEISTNSDGTITVASDGNLPRVNWRELHDLQLNLQELGESTGQDVVITHAGRELATLKARALRPPRWSIRWLSIFREWIYGS
jgi:hypothetical protein